MVGYGGGRLKRSQMTRMDRLLVSGLPVVAFISLNRGRSCWFRPCPSPTYYATRQRVNRLRHADPSNAEPSTPLKHFMTTADGSPLPTDAMLVDHDTSNPLMSLSSRDFPVPSDQPPRNKRSPKAKKQQKWCNLCLQRPSRRPLVCLGVCIVTIHEALVFEKVPLRPWNHRSPRGAFTLLGPNSIYQISL